MFDPPTMGILPSSRLLRVHLFRHGEVEGRRVCRGRSDVALSPLGSEQTRRAAEWFGRSFPEPRTVVGSDLARCRALATTIDPDAAAEPRLREQDMGDWEGRPWEELTGEDPRRVTAYWDDYVNARPPGGETFGECYARVTRWWDAQEFDAERVVLVTHIGVIRALVCHWMGLGPGQALRWAPAYASHSAVLLADAGCVVESFGDTGFL